MFDAGACVLSFIGVVFVAQPEFLFGASTEAVSTAGSSSMNLPPLSPAFHTVCVVIGVVGAVLSSLSYLTVRSIGNGAPSNTIVLWYGMMGVVISGVLSLATGQWLVPQSWSDVGLFVAMGALVRRGVKTVAGVVSRDLG